MIYLIYLSGLDRDLSVGRVDSSINRSLLCLERSQINLILALPTRE